MIDKLSGGEIFIIYSSYLGAGLALNPDGEKNCKASVNL